MEEPPPSYDEGGTKSDASNLPSPERCILHLRLLAAFARLRDTVRQHGGLFDCQDSEKVSKADLRWTIFVARAVQRFETWYDNLLEAEVAPASNGNKRPKRWLEDPPDLATRATMAWAEQYLLPLDGLMVLHSYMLNPRAFLEDCARTRLLSLWGARFPWGWVEQYLDPKDFLYRLPSDWYEMRAGDRRNGEDTHAFINCPGCTMTSSTPWIDLFSGYSDQSEKGNLDIPFRIQCTTCGQSITQETLALARLRDDLKELQDHGVPLSGTVLSTDGVLGGSRKDDTKPRPQLTALNDLLGSRFGQRLLQDLTDQLSNSAPQITLDEIQGEVEREIARSDNASQPFMQRALKKLMTRYRNNPSPFSLDLVGAVLRQGTFIDKMQNFDWIHSPALRHTTGQATQRYTGFFQVMARHPNDVAVPTFDVDLVWHTHQLSPCDYYSYSTRHCDGVFIDHDDKIGDGVLGNQFEWTCEAYQKIIGKHYDKCLCWSCALLEEASMKPLPPQSKPTPSITSRLRHKLKNPGQRFEPSSAEIEVIRIQLKNFEDDYAKITAKSTEKNGLVPSKLDFYYAYNWHHPSLAPLAQELKP
jgi:hypothetical protein